MKAIEVTGIIDKQGNLSIDRLIPTSMQGQVRVIILYSELDEVTEPDDLDNEPTEEVYAGLHRAFQQAALGQRIPLSQLWQGIAE